MANKKIRVAINGFGRIGRQFFKAVQTSDSIEIVAINDLSDIDNIRYLLKHDTVYGMYEKEVLVENGSLSVDGRTIRYVSEKDPAQLPWKELDIDVVVESTGFFTSYDKAKAHLEAGAKRVVISAPAKDDGDTPTLTPNVNMNAATLSLITSNASCTTNAVVPLASILGESVGIVYSVLNTIHAYTSTQSTVDGPAKDYRKGRTAAQNIVPTSTGAALAAAKAIPGMKDKFDGIAVRVPVPAASLIDFTFISERPTSVEEVNDILRDAAKKDVWKGIFDATDEPLVSSDIIRNPHGSTADLALTRVVGGTLVKVMAWYDNEWGYVHMLRKHVESLTPLL